MNGLTITDVLDQLGEAGLRMAQLDAAEGAAGNISVYLAGDLQPPSSFGPQGEIELPVTVPELAGGAVAITGTGRRLRNIARRPEMTVCLLRIAAGGRRAELYAGAEIRPTSELNTHLAVHNDHVGRRGLVHHAVLHAQPIHLTYLSHLPRYADTRTWNRRLLRWQPETIVEFPEGIGVLPFQLPGSSDQMAVTMRGLAQHRGIVWSRHGIVTRADTGVDKAADLVDYAETAARYEYLNLVAGEPTTGLSDEELRLFCERQNIQQTFF